MVTRSAVIHALDARWSPGAVEAEGEAVRNADGLDAGDGSDAVDDVLEVGGLAGVVGITLLVRGEELRDVELDGGGLRGMEAEVDVEDV